MTKATSLEFCHSVLGGGIRCLVTFPGAKHHQFHTDAEMVSKATELDAMPGIKAVYHACATYAEPQVIGPDGKPKFRIQSNVCELKCLWLDIDCGPDKAAKGAGYATQVEAARALRSFVKDNRLPAPTWVVNSGNGLHVYWVFPAAVDRATWEPTAARGAALCKAAEFRADPSRTKDAASVLRLPGTMNRKDPADPKPVSIVVQGEETTFDAFDAAVTAALGRYGAKAAPSLPHRVVTGVNADLTGGLVAPPPTETPENIEMVRAMLNAIPADCGRDDWRGGVWACASLDAAGWKSAHNLAHDWSAGCPEKFDQADFDRVWADYNHAGGVGFGTLERIAKEHGYKAPVTPAAATGEPRSGNGSAGDSGDILNGRLFANYVRGTLLYVHERGIFLAFDAQAGWVKAAHGEEARRAKAVVAKMRAGAAEAWKTAPDDPKIKRLMLHIERSSSASKIQAMIELAKSEPNITTSLTLLDADPMLLGVVGGVLDLRIGARLDVSPGLLVTKRCAVAFDPAAKAPIFDAFMARVTRGNPDVATYLQHLAGYILTGHVTEHIFAFLFGLGANGKSTFVELLRWLLGDYAVTVPTATLMMGKRDPGAASPDLMLLKGARLAIASETEEGSRFAESQLKLITGGDTLTAREPYGAYVSWTPTHKLLLVGNHKPVISGGDLGIWRRVRLIPFLETIAAEERDPRLLDKLKAEGSGVLNWAIAGLGRWQRRGLVTPAVVEAAAAEYRTDMDVLRQWLDDHTKAGERTPTVALYRAYSAWARASGIRAPLTRLTFARRLGERGFMSGKVGGVMQIAGLHLNAEGLAASASNS